MKKKKTLVLIFMLVFLGSLTLIKAQGAQVLATFVNWSYTNQTFDNDETSALIQLKIVFTSAGPTNYTVQISLSDEGSYLDLNDHNNVSSWSIDQYYNYDHVNIYIDVTEYSVGTHTAYFKSIDHYNGDAADTVSTQFSRLPDSSDIAINLTTTNTDSDRYFSNEPNLKIGTYDVSGLDNGYLQVGDWNQSTNSDITTISNQSITTTYNKEISIDSYDFVTGSSVSYGDKFQVRDDWSNATSGANMDSWDYRLNLSMYNAGATLSTYAVKVEITNSMGVYDQDKADGADWRIIEGDSMLIRKHWIESYNDAGTTILWFNAYSFRSGYKTFWLYFGNAAASSSESASDVFYEWDNFDDGYSDGDPLQAGRGWNVAGGTPTVEDYGGDSMAMELFVDDSAGTADQIQSLFGSTTPNIIVHFDVYCSVTYAGQFYLGGLETALSVALTRIGNDDGSYFYYDGSYKDFTPVIDLSDATFYEFEFIITDSDFDLDVDGTNHDGALRNAYVTGINRFDFTPADTNDGDLTVRIDDFYVRDYVATEPTLSGYELQDPYTLNNSISISEVKTSTPAETGANYWVNYTTNAECLFNSEITLTLNLTAITLYTGATTDSRIDYFLFNSSIWDHLNEGMFFVNVTIEDDLAATFTQSFECWKITTNPDLEILSPLNDTTYKLNDPVGLTWTVDLFYNMSYTEYVYLNGTLKDYSLGDSLLLAAGDYYLTIKIEDPAGNINTSTTWFYIRQYEETRITYKTVYGSKIDFDVFSTYTTIGAASRTPELNGYFDMIATDQVRIETYSDFDLLLHDSTYDHNETIFIALPVHYVQFANYNITANMIITLQWENQTMEILLGVGAISEPILIYRSYDYIISWSANGHITETMVLEGYEIQRGTISLALSPSKDLSLALNPLALISYVGVAIFAVQFVLKLRPKALRDEKREEKAKSKVWVIIQWLLFTFAIAGVGVIMVIFLGVESLAGLLIAFALVLLITLSVIHFRKKNKNKIEVL